MKTHSHFFGALGLVALIVLGCFLVNPLPASGYTNQPASPVAGTSADRVDRQESSPFLAAVSSASVGALTEAEILALPAFDLTDLPSTSNRALAEYVRGTESVTAVFSHASLTCTVEVWRVYVKSVSADGKTVTKGLKGRTTLTFAGDSVQRFNDTTFWTDEQYVSSGGAIELRFVIKAFSGSTSQSVKLRVGSF